MEFTDKWLNKETIKLSKEEMSSYQRFLLELLTSHLVFIEKKGIKSISDYEKIKREIIFNKQLVDVDEKKAKVFRDLKNKK